MQGALLPSPLLAGTLHLGTTEGAGPRITSSAVGQWFSPGEMAERTPGRRPASKLPEQGCHGNICRCPPRRLESQLGLWGVSKSAQQIAPNLFPED